MKNDNITLAEIIKMRGGSLEELCEYAKSKGITLPHNEEKSISQSELKAIDPVLAFQMKYAIPQSNKEEKHTSPINLSENLSNTASDTSKSKEIIPKQKKTNLGNDKRVIGIVKFFDSNKEFGFANCNCKNISGKSEDEHTIFSFYLTQREWISTLYPEKDEWVIFTPQKNNRGQRVASKIERLTFDKEHLMFAMKYRGRYAKIKGDDAKGDKIDKNILVQILSNLEKKLTPLYGKNKESELAYATAVIDAFCTYLSNYDPTQQNNIISQFLEDDELFHLLTDVFLGFTYESDDEIKKSAWTNFRNVLADKLFASDDISILESLPQNFNPTFCIEKIKDLLIHSAADSPGPTETWLKNHQQITESITLDPSSTATIPLRFILKEITGAEQWLNELNIDFQTTDVEEDLKCKLYLETGKSIYIQAIKNKGIAINWLKGQTDNIVSSFLDLYLAQDKRDIEQSDLDLFGKELIVRCIKLHRGGKRLQMLQQLPEKYALSLVTHYFAHTSLFDLYIGEKWNTLKSEVPYIAFDIESDGTNIQKFSFLTEDNIRTYEGEDQLKSLIRKLNKQQIIVGHNIKQWDIPILETKGLKTNAWIWDTLEMEILLNPCRYAYSLHTTHQVEEDTKIVNDLFWNQLYRLSQDKELVQQLKSVLPKQINNILKNLQVDYFTEYFVDTAKRDQQFFQELRPLSKNLTQQLDSIAALPQDELTLIIAPENLWPHLAQRISLEFPVVQDPSTFLCIDQKKLHETPFENILEQKILERFCTVSKTPIFENLAVYLKVDNPNSNKIFYSKERLENYLKKCESHIDCIDINAFEDPSILNKPYQHIYIIGAELNDRVHKCKVCEDKSFADLIALGSKLPFIMANSNFAPIYEKERIRLGIKEPELTANMWVERQQNGRFSFYLNYQYQAYRKRFLEHFNVKPEKVINWEVEGEDPENINITQVSRVKDSTGIERVNASTTQRSKYWLFQMEILKKIHAAHPTLPLVYIISDLAEREELVAYATALGFYIPQNGTGFRKLEYIGNHAHGMIIISKKQFQDEISSYRTDKPFCYVWDNMNIDRYLLMWNKLPFEDDLEESNDADRDDKSRHTTARQCIYAAWPILEHYCSLVMANSKDTAFYVLDPHFDDYDDLACSCKAQTFKVNLWTDNDSYSSDLAKAETFFQDSRRQEMDIDIAQQKQMILSQWGFTTWRNNQEEIIDHMLQKKGDCIISMPTGGGKSILFQGPAISRAMQTQRLSLVITPLRALMQDQVEELQRRGFVNNVDYLSGDRLYPEVQNIYRKIRSGDLALLFITPERFRVRSFINVLSQRMETDGGLEYVVFDEAHCISQWGQDFRPDYRNAVLTCIEFRQKYDFMFALFSATVTNQVEQDIRSFLPGIQRIGQDPEDYNPVRQHIGISFTITDNDDTDRINQIVKYIEENQIDFSKSCMIVFCRTQRQCEETADALSEKATQKEVGPTLSKCANHIGYYHAGLDADQRNDIYEKFKRNEGVEPIYILCATKAFGMGMDIPNVHYVVHYNPPAVLEDYLQEVGRAGRSKEMYEAAFPNHHQIPALCLTSTDDFKKMKDLLVKSQMSWSNLTDAKNKILDFIQKFQSIDETRTAPIVVPFSVWTKNAEDFNNTTSSRLAFHWLDHIGYIKQGYLGQTCLEVVLYDNQFHTLHRSSTNRVYQYLCDHIQQKGVKILVPINELRNALRLSTTNIINQMIQAMKAKRLHLDNKMQCRITPRRYSEVKFMRLHNDNRFALHIIMEGLRHILSTCKIGKPHYIDPKQREELYRHLMDDVDYNDIIKENHTAYMPWYKDEDIEVPRGAVIKVDTFKKNIITRMGAQMFNILPYLPGVTYRTSKIDEDVIVEILLKNNRWREYLESLENDCLKIISFVYEQNGKFCWAQEIINLEWTGKGVRYYEDVLSILQHLQYVEHSPLIETGIEILTTPLSETDIDDGLVKDSPMNKYREDFDQQERIKKVRLACMNIFTSVDKQKQGAYIQRYFQSRTYEDYLSLAGEYVPEGSEIMAELTEQALKIEEEKIYGNPSKNIPVNIEQVQIYEQPKNVHINILAGPGSGKTHMLTMRCAQLIYKEHVEPSHLLVLAYNRAVVVELRNRLNALFTRLGMSRIANQIHVYTFSALAKKCMGKRLENISINLWEESFLQYLQNNKNDFLANIPQIEFVLIDEFQDITDTRLQSLLSIHDLFPDAKFFTIGDINQSIYGFDRVPKDYQGRKLKVAPEIYAKILDPRPYYEKLNQALHPVQLTMFTNYRSYQAILDKAKMFLTSDAEVPKSASSIMKYEPKETYVFDNLKGAWFEELSHIIDWAEEENQKAKSITDNDFLHGLRQISTIAIFFRTNNEVYRGYSKIKNRLPENIRIRIQGESLCELWREREVFYLIHTLLEKKDELVDLHNNRTANDIREHIIKTMEDHLNWDAFMLDVTYTLVLNYIDAIRSDNQSHTMEEMAEYIKEIASKDDGGQVYKIYDNYRSERILQENKLTIVLTTMHKVKGLEFDVVLITPSFSNLPLAPHHEYEKGTLPQVDDLADLEEEKRLMYVAYTRAKKRLYIFKSDREQALLNQAIYLAPDYATLRYTEPKAGMDNYFLSYTAQNETLYERNKYILEQIKKDDSIEVKAEHGYYYILHNKTYIGRLSSKSTILKRAKEDEIIALRDFFVSNIFVWTYEDTIKSDLLNNTTFAKLWCEYAKQKGYIYVVQIAGFGIKE